MSDVFLLWTGYNGGDHRLQGVFATHQDAKNYIAWLHPKFSLEHEYADKLRDLYARDPDFGDGCCRWARIDQAVMLGRPGQDAWVPVTTGLPPLQPSDGGWGDSVPVLMTDGEQCLVGFHRHYPEYTEETDRWFIKGRDGYIMENVTHWQYLPPLPC